MRIGIVGTGAFARTHAHAVGRHEELELAGFAGHAPDSAGVAAEEFGSVAYPGLGALLDDRPDGVVLATPHDTHAPLGAQVLAAGIPVLVEKPLARTAAECDTLLAAEASAPVRGMVGHLMRWAPAHRRARELLEAGVIGRPLAAESRRVIPWNAATRRPWQRSAAAGGGMWLIQGVHVIDQLTWLLGARASEIVGLADTRSHPDQDADDLGLALARFDEVPVTLTIAGTRSAAADVETRIVGTDGILRVSHRGTLEVDTGTGPEDLRVPATRDAWEATLDGELSAFAAVIRGAEPDVSFEYGRHVVATVDALRRSIDSRRWEHV